MGTVAFLMSDIEGSTRLIGVAGDAYPQLLDDHHRLLRESIGRGYRQPPPGHDVARDPRVQP